MSFIFCTCLVRNETTFSKSFHYSFQGQKTHPIWHAKACKLREDLTEVCGLSDVHINQKLCQQIQMQSVYTNIYNIYTYIYNIHTFVCKISQISKLTSWNQIKQRTKLIWSSLDEARRAWKAVDTRSLIKRDKVGTALGIGGNDILYIRINSVLDILK